MTYFDKDPSQRPQPQVEHSVDLDFQVTPNSGVSNETAAQVVHCAALVLHATKYPHAFCRWASREIEIIDGLPITHEDCPIKNFANTTCGVGLTTKFHSYEYVEAEMGGIVLDNGKRVTEKQLKKYQKEKENEKKKGPQPKKYKMRKGEKVYKLQLRENPPDLSKIYGNTHSGDVNRKVPNIFELLPPPTTELEEQP